MSTYLFEMSGSTNVDRAQRKTVLLAFFGITVVAIGAIYYSLRIADDVSPIQSPFKTQYIPHCQDFETSSPGPFAGKYHLLLPTNKIDRGSCWTTATFLINRWDVNVLWTKPDDGEKMGYSDAVLAKIESVKGFLHREDVHEDDMVIMSDALDVWAQKSPEETLDTYSFADRITIGAELNCYPFAPTSVMCRYVPHLSPINPDRYSSEVESFGHGANWLNSGFVMGPVRRVRSFYKAASLFSRLGYLTELDKVGSPTFGNDQAIFQALYLSQEFPVSLDQTHSLVASMWHMGPLTDFAAPPTAESKRPPLLHVKPSDTFPSLVHFNGQKELFTEWWDRTWWGDKARANETDNREAWDRVRQGQLHFVYSNGDSEVRRWGDVCSGVHGLEDFVR